MRLWNREFKEVIGLDFFLAIATGLVDGFKHVHKFAENQNVWTSWVTIRGYGSIYEYLTAATKLKAASTSANDTAAGTGARTILITWLDANFHEIEEIVTLNWQTPVETIKEFYRVNKTSVLTAWSSNAQAWNIYVWTWTFTAWVPTQTISWSLQENWQSLNSYHTIPAGYTWFIRIWKASAPSWKSADIKFYSREIWGIFKVQHTLSLYQNNYDYNFIIPRPIPEKTDIEARAISTASGTKVTFAYDLILIKN